MFKFLRRLLCVAILAICVFGYLVVTRGGEPFRWFGKRAETTLDQVGKKIKDYATSAADNADRLQESSRDAREAVEKLREVRTTVLNPGDSKEASGEQPVQQDPKGRP